MDVNNISGIPASSDGGNVLPAVKTTPEPVSKMKEVVNPILTTQANKASPIQATSSSVSAKSTLSKEDQVWIDLIENLEKTNKKIKNFDASDADDDTLLDILRETLIPMFDSLLTISGPELELNRDVRKQLNNVFLKHIDLRVQRNNEKVKQEFTNACTAMVKSLITKLTDKNLSLEALEAASKGSPELAQAIFEFSNKDKIEEAFKTAASLGKTRIVEFIFFMQSNRGGISKGTLEQAFAAASENKFTETIIFFLDKVDPDTFRRFHRAT